MITLLTHNIFFLLILSCFFLKRELMGSKKKRKLEENAIPTKFCFTKETNKRIPSEQRAEKKIKKQVRSSYFLKNLFLGSCQVLFFIDF